MCLHCKTQVTSWHVINIEKKQSSCFLISHLRTHMFCEEWYKFHWSFNCSNIPQILIIRNGIGSFICSKELVGQSNFLFTDLNWTAFLLLESASWRQQKPFVIGCSKFFRCEKFYKFTGVVEPCSLCSGSISICDENVLVRGFQIHTWCRLASKLENIIRLAKSHARISRQMCLVCVFSEFTSTHPFSKRTFARPHGHVPAQLKQPELHDTKTAGQKNIEVLSSHCRRLLDVILWLGTGKPSKKTGFITRNHAGYVRHTNISMLYRESLEISRPSSPHLTAGRSLVLSEWSKHERK